jgi:hypothetical protein
VVSEGLARPAALPRLRPDRHRTRRCPSCGATTAEIDDIVETPSAKPSHRAPRWVRPRHGSRLLRPHQRPHPSDNHRTEGARGACA